MKFKKILVTGGFGYVGSRLTPLLLEQGYDVRVLDLCLYGDDGLVALEAHPKFPEWRNRFELVRGDIRNPQVVDKAMAGREAVIHLAAISNDPTGEIDEVLTRQVNFDAVGLLVAKAKSCGVRRFIAASSSSVFGIKKESNVSEDLEPEPITFYSKYKMLAEWIVAGASSPEFTTVNIRPATICGYSPRQRFDLTVNKLTCDAVTKQLITVHGGQQRRPNLGMTDMIVLYAQLLELPSEVINGRTFNFGFENLKVLEIAQLIQQKLEDPRVKINVTETLDNRDYHISSAKILRELHYKPVSSIGREVMELQAKIRAGAFADPEGKKHFNMKSMQIGRDPAAYQFLSR